MCLSQALVHFVIDRASLFTDHRISVLPIRAKYKHLKTIGEHTFDNLPTDVNSSSVKWWSSTQRPWRNTDIFRVLKFFSSQRGNSRIQTLLCNCPRCLCLFHIVFECSPSKHDQGKMLVLPIRLLYWVLSTSDQDFVSFQPILCHPHTQIIIILLHGVQTNIPNWKPPNRAAIRFSQIAFPMIVLPKDDHTDSVQVEQVGLRYWTMIQAICVLVNESKCLNIPILEFSNNVGEHPSCLMGISRHCISSLSIAIRQSGNDIHDCCCCHLWYW